MEIRVENLSCIYNPGTPIEVRALEDVSFTLPAGSVLGVLGGTGSGKTTLIKHLNGILVPTRGRVLLDGKETQSMGPELKRRVGVVFQRPERQLFETTVYRDISYALRRFTMLTEGEIRSRAASVGDLLGLKLDWIAERSPFALSDGEKRKVALAGVLVNDPEVLVLDEPAVGLDPPSQGDLLHALEGIVTDRMRSLVIVSHDMEPFLPMLDSMLVLQSGRVVAMGAPTDLCASLAGDPAISAYLPPLAVLVHELRNAGYDLPAGEFRISVLAERLAHLIGS